MAAVHKIVMSQQVLLTLILIITTLQLAAIDELDTRAGRKTDADVDSIKAAIVPNEIKTSPITISASGSYRLTEDLAGALTINANDVFLDLNGHRISTTSGNIITINSSKSDIVIKNGLLEGNGASGTTKGILINSSCARIKLADVRIAQCGIAGIDIDSSTDITVENCEIIQCSTNTSSSEHILDLNSADRILIKNCRLNNNGNSSRAVTGIALTACTQCVSDTIEISGNQGSSFKGISLTTSGSESSISEGNKFFRCLIDKNSSSSTTLIGVELITAASGDSVRANLFEQCQLIDNSATTTLSGFKISPTTGSANKIIGNIFSQCVVVRNTGTGIKGIELTGTIGTSETNNNTFLDCIVSRNNASSGAATGISIEGANDSTILRCIITYNTASTTAIGIDFASGSGGNNWEIKDCEISRNEGSNAANSYGIRRQAGANNLFVKNIAFLNGPSGASTSGNQLSGVASTSVTTPSSIDNINAADLPWTNLALVS